MPKDILNCLYCRIDNSYVLVPPSHLPFKITGIFYPDWDGDNKKCLEDGNEPEHMVLDPDMWLYDNLEECCERYYPGWNKNVCMGSEGSGLWYVNYAKGKCMTDCEVGNGNMCGGVANLAPDELFMSPKTCCAKKLPWVLNKLCEVRSLLFAWVFLEMCPSSFWPNSYCVLSQIHF